MSKISKKKEKKVIVTDSPKLVKKKLVIVTDSPKLVINSKLVKSTSKI